MAEREYLCRWLGDDESGWEDWVLADESDPELVFTVRASSPQAAASRFLGDMRAEDDEQLPANTRVGVREKCGVEIFTAEQLAGRSLPPGKGSSYELLIVDGPEQPDFAMVGDDRWRVRAADALSAALRGAHQLGELRRLRAHERIAVRRDPGPVRLFLALDDHSAKVRAGRSDEVDIRLRWDLQPVRWSR